MECKSLRDSGSEIRRYEVAYFAASVDSVEKNAEFAKSLALDYPILSDPEKSVASAYGVLNDSGEYARRWTFYINKEGKIDKIDNTEQVAELNDLTDVTITSQASGEVLKYDGSAWINAALTTSDVSGVATDADLTTLEGRVTTNEGDITTLDGRVTTNEGDINAIELEVGTIESGAGLNSNGTYTPDATIPTA